MGIVVLTIALLCACATAPPEEELPSAESYYQRGVELLKGRRVFLFFTDVDYPEAIESFQEVIDNYPYSEFAVLSELAIADIHFERDEYEEASSYYHDFVELHPNHPKVAYALYRNGLCSYNQMRAADRDQAPTREAVAQFRALLERFPSSEMAPDAQGAPVRVRGPAGTADHRHRATSTTPRTTTTPPRGATTRRSRPIRPTPRARAR